MAAAVLAGLFVGISCTRTPLQRAINRELLPSEANVIVTSQCQGCHVHAKFDSDAHLLLIKEKYSESNPLRDARECLECHVLKLENYFRREFRSTSRPHGQLVQMSDIPNPSDLNQEKAGKTKIKEAPVVKKKKWYFFYLF